jgi:hypothetical protein
MSIQYISDNLGNKTAVIIPIEDWEKIPNKYKEQLDEPNLEMSPADFMEWIENAEKSSTLPLEELNAKWEKKKKELMKLIP